jgi:hypothetical protein
VGVGVSAEGQTSAALIALPTWDTFEMTQDRPADVKRHYLPAAAIGYFSKDQSPEKARKRVVWVLRKDSNEPRPSTAERVGYMKRIYGYGKGFGMDHDDYFKDAESFVHGPVDLLMQSEFPWVDADSWIQLTLYVTTQIARGPDLEQRAVRLAKEQGRQEDRIAVGYPLNAQRISSAVLRARWQFIYSPDKDFVLGDRGVMGIYHSQWETFGYFMPLRRNFGIILGRAPYEKQLKWDNGAWRIEIEMLRISENIADRFNQIM